MKKNLKKVISTVAALAITGSAFTAFAADFSDVPETATYKQAINELVALKVIAGYEDGTFKPDDQIKRSEVTKMIVAAMGPSFTQSAEAAAGVDTQFSDVPGSHWAAGYISTGVANNFVNGMGDGTFAPDASVTYAQTVKMLVSALGYGSAAEASGGWPTGYMTIGGQIGITTGVTGASSDTAVTRAQVAQLIDNALDTPVVAVTSWGKDAFGNPVANTEIMDGTDGKKYETLLTMYHDAYKVKGRVDGTFKTGGVNDKEQVSFKVELADNFDGDVYEKGDSDRFQMYYGDTNAPDLLFTYADTLIQKDSNDDYTILAITPYGKNTITEIAADLMDEDCTFKTGDNYNTLEAYTSETSSRKTTYKLDTAASMYVNGVEIPGGISEESLDAYIRNDNKSGTVTLIDTPQDGSSSKDGNYDYVMVTYYKVGIVDSVTKSGDINKINLLTSESGLGGSLEIDLTDEDREYNFYMDDKEITIDDIQQNDVISVLFDPQDKFNNSDFGEIYVTRNVVEGKVVSSSTKSDGTPTYQIDGTKYTSVLEGDTLEVGTEYTLYVDMFGRFIYAEETATSRLYGIVDRIYRDTATQEYKVRLVNNSGSVVSYDVRKDDDVASWIGNGDSFNNDKSVEVKDRMVTYKLTGKNEIYEIKKVNPQSATDVEYKERLNRIGSYTLSDTTVIIDASKVVENGTKYQTSDYSALSLSSLVDGQEYSVLAYDKNSSDSTYRFIVITAGASAIGINSAIAVIDSTGDEENPVDNTNYPVLYVYTAGSDDLVKVFVDEAEVDMKDFGLDKDGNAKYGSISELPKGTAIAYSTNSDGVADQVKAVLPVSLDLENKGTGLDLYTFVADLGASNFLEDADGRTNWYFKTGIESWNKSSNSTNAGRARVAFGPVTEKSGNSISLATVTKDGNNYISTVEDRSDNNYSISASANVYVYDYTRRANSRLSKGTVGDIQKINLGRSYNDADVNWDTVVNEEGVTPYYAMAKMVDDEIVDILYIIPNDTNR